MLRFSPMEWWFWNARTGFWISLPQTQMQTQERINRMTRLGSCYEMANFSKKNEKKEFPLHFTPFSPQFPSNVRFKAKTPGLPCRMRHIFRSLKSLKIFSRMAPFSPILHRTFWTLSIPTAGAVPCKGKRLPSRRRRAWDLPSGGKRALTSAVQYEPPGNDWKRTMTKSTFLYVSLLFFSCLTI